MPMPSRDTRTGHATSGVARDAVRQRRLRGRDESRPGRLRVCATTVHSCIARQRMCVSRFRSCIMSIQSAMKEKRIGKPSGKAASDWTASMVFFRPVPGLASDMHGTHGSRRGLLSVVPSGLNLAVAFSKRQPNSAGDRDRCGRPADRYGFLEVGASGHAATETIRHHSSGCRPPGMASKAKGLPDENQRRPANLRGIDANAQTATLRAAGATGRRVAR
jgi:hypothetical protein